MMDKQVQDLLNSQAQMCLGPMPRRFASLYCLALGAPLSAQLTMT